ncbi:phenazine biosynthesis-like domain-containing protein isoform X3 [Macaca fascicularis]|uniref:phenazine biosynthesis-like domain-containing protein isoform X3 n=1 Tax=Macaca fascicularis TaxID=9541 RepID=UPI0003AB9E4A|nr:phenazine biosynthesis-like domain-containing protein isoform X5 [Macaca fascicularis]
MKTSTEADFGSRAGCPPPSGPELLAVPQREDIKQATSNFENLQKQLARKMKLPIFIADAFTARAFRGNPAAVCLLENELEEDMHQKIAREMNLSETAFIRKLHPTDNFAQSSCFGLRWFTPASEVPLCGHATLASAAVLFYKIKNMNSTLTFVTLSGELRARQAEDGIVLDLPLYPVYPQDFHEVEDLIKTAIGNTLVQDICYSPDTRKLLLRLSDTYNRSFLENLKVNTENLLQVENTGKVKGLILTLKGEPGGQSQSFDFYSRYFAPWVGVAEDPVTGSAHAVLSSYWSQQLGKKEMHAFQCSQRGGELGISLRPAGRVDIRGGAAVVLEGTLTA